MEFLEAFRKSRPSKNENRAGWNESWEEELRVLYSLVEESKPGLSKDASMSSVWSSLFTSHHRTLFDEQVRRQACKAEEDLRKFALESLTTDDFEAKWKGLTQKRREELVLEGLYQTCSVGMDVEQSRTWCPDLTLTNLAGNGGNGYIDMLKTLLSNHAGARVVEPTLFPHAGLDKLYGMIGEGCQVPLEVQRDRSRFITYTLWRILLAFYGKSQEVIRCKPVRESRPSGERDALKAERTNFFGEGWKKTAKEMLRILESDHTKPDGIAVCWVCNKDATKLGTGQKLQACSGCKGIKRKLLYCSKECQKYDWKRGNPPHKDICGKVVTSDFLENLAKKTVEEDHRIPTPDPGFQRSPALQHQIMRLNEFPHADYYFINPMPIDDWAIILADRPSRKSVLIMRHRALKNGDKKAVRFLYQFLETLIKSGHVPDYCTVSRLKQQFRSEYGDLNFEYKDEHFEDPTEEENALAEKIMDMEAIPTALYRR